ncbi:MAG: DNA-binding response regulator, partial [Planctomycetes bacterium]|nr:DNA-binding response regulator [Planctomycetota bacterium]
METQRVLVVEDEADIREMVSYNLAKAGFEVVEV